MDNNTSLQPSPFSGHYQHFQIRTATEKDVPSIAKMIKGLAEFLGESDKLKIGEKELLHDGFGERPLFHCIVAEDVAPAEDEGLKGLTELGIEMSSTGMAQQKRQDEILGMAIYYYAYSTWEGAMLYVEDIFVLPNVREQGVGTVLMEALAKVAKSRDCCRMQWVSPHNQRTLRFYKKLGATSMPDWLLLRIERKEIEQLSSRNVLNNDDSYEKAFLTSLMATPRMRSKGANTCPQVQKSP